MPILRNARHEKFCQAIVGGEVPEKAYEKAGFKADRSNAFKLQHKNNIKQRIDELFAELNSAQKREIVKAADKAALSRAGVLQMLIEDREFAKSVNQASAAVRAIELIGKELGMFIDRSLTKTTEDIFESVDDAELRRMVAERVKQLAADDGETRH